MASVLVDIARILHQTRLKRGLSQEDLAARAGVPVAEIAAYESDPAALSAKLALRVFEAEPPDAEDLVLSDPPEGSPDLGFPDLAFPSAPPAGMLNDMEARMHEMGAALAIDKREFSRALEDLNRALSLRPSEERIGPLLISLAAVFAELGHEEESLQALAQAAGHFDAGSEPKLWLRIRLEQLFLLCQVGRFDEAAALAGDALDLASRVGDERERLDAHCLVARIAAGAGRLQEALPLLQEAREQRLAAGRVREAVAIALDLAAVLIEDRHPAELTALAQELEALCRRRKLAISVSSRLKMFCRSVRGNCADAARTRALARELWRVIGRLRRPYMIPIRSRGAAPSL